MAATWRKGLVRRYPKVDIDWRELMGCDQERSVERLENKGWDVVELDCCDVVMALETCDGRAAMVRVTRRGEVIANVSLSTSA